MKVGRYASHEPDAQGLHKQDELYVVISGSGDFVKGMERQSFAPHDVLFVEAGVEHRFENFSADFATWVIFRGGGRRAGSVRVRLSSCGTSRSSRSRRPRDRAGSAGTARAPHPPLILP